MNGVTPKIGLELAQQTVFLMGVSFILGSLVTIFILLILDMLRAIKAGQGAPLAPESLENESLEDGLREDEGEWEESANVRE